MLSPRDELAYQARKIIGSNLKRLRITANLLQETVAQDIGMNGSGVSAMELGRLRIPLDRLALMAAAFKLGSVEELIVELGRPV
jgi:transcriptional regulator with XRE-family HTH domain